MDILVLTLAMIFLSVQSIFFKLFSRDYQKSITDFFLFNTLLCSVAALIFLIYSGGVSQISEVTVVLGLIFGLLYITAVLTYLKAMSTGPLAYSTLFSSCGLLVPVIAGPLFWQESISFLQFGGIILLLIAYYFGVNPGGKNNTRIRPVWVAYGITTMISNGLLGVLQKWHQTLLPGKEIQEFLIISFGSAALFSLIAFLRTRYIKGMKAYCSLQWRLTGLVTAAGVCAASGNLTVMYLTGRLPGTVLFPIVNGGIVLASAAFSVLIFKERLSRGQIAGLALGMLSIALVGGAG